MPFLFFPKVILSRLCDNSVFNTQGTDCILRVNQTSLKTFFVMCEYLEIARSTHYICPHIHLTWNNLSQIKTQSLCSGESD